MLEMQTSQRSTESIVIEARANLSMTLDRLMGVFAGLSLVTLLVTVWPLLMGLWPILLAALFHLAIVGWCFRAAWRGNWARESLRIEGDDLVVEHFRAGHQSRTEWPVAWTRVYKESGRLSDLRVFVGSQGRRQEVGAFLPVGERAELAAMLEKALRARSAWGGSQTIRVS